jgi:hypothetical protein
VANRQRSWRSIARSWRGPWSIAVVAVVGIALAVFAGLSSDDPSAAGGDPPDGVIAADDERSIELAAAAADLAIPTAPALRLDRTEGAPIVVDGPAVDLRVLVLAVGEGDLDLAREHVTDVMDIIGVAYDEIDVGVTDLTEELLRDGDRGRYNGVILTGAELLLPDGTPGFTAEEWQLLHDYERDFGVREAVLSGFPGENVAAGYDYGMEDIRPHEELVGRLADGTASSVLAGVAVDSALPIAGPLFSAVARSGGPGPAVEPLLVDAADPERILIARLRYDDGRDVLLSTVPNEEFLAHARLLTYDFVAFATSGVHLGAARVHLSVHVDDLFIASPPWDTELNRPRPENAIRADAGDIEAVVVMQDRLVAEHDTLDGFRVEFAFNGAGAALPDPGDADDGAVDTDDDLTDAVVANRDALWFLNHTYTHRDMDTSAGTTAEQSRVEVLHNRVMWERLGLPDADENAGLVVTGEHSGVSDDPRDGDPADVVPYPEGLNTAMAEAFESVGVRALAGDSSRTAQGSEQQVPGHELVLLPRYPTGVLYNAADPEQLVDQYNHLFHERFVEAGEDPCAVPAAVCEPLGYDELLAREAELTVRHMLSFRRWPHYFHILNVVDHDGEGSSLLGDWLDAVMAEYERVAALPVDNLPFWEIERRTRADLEARAAGPVAVLDLSTGEVVVTAGRAIELAITGVAGGDPYGAVAQSRIQVGPTPTRLPVAAN